VLAPDAWERSGHVPDVLCSCGGLPYDGTLWLPYAGGDTSVSVATVPLPALMDRL
jgi:predicted GH43/DUF377 family glycosyl hydrolase